MKASETAAVSVVSVTLVAKEEGYRVKPLGWASNVVFVSFPLRGKREERVKKRLASEACQWSHPERHSFPSLHLLFTQVRIQRRKLSLLCLWVTVELSWMHFLSFSPLLEIFVRKSVNGNRVTDDTKWRRERECIFIPRGNRRVRDEWEEEEVEGKKEAKLQSYCSLTDCQTQGKTAKMSPSPRFFLMENHCKMSVLLLSLSVSLTFPFAVVCGIGFSCLVLSLSLSLQCVVSWVPGKQHIQGYLGENMCLTCHVIFRDSVRDPGAEKREAVGEEKGEVLLP